MVIEMDEETKEQVTQRFEILDDDISLHLFVGDHMCLYCNDTKALVEQVAELSDKVSVVIHKGGLDDKDAKEYGVTRNPTTAIVNKGEAKIRFNGIPAGREFGAFIASIIDVSTGFIQLPPTIIEDIKAIDKPVRILVFTTPQCPYCPDMVRLSIQAALANPLIEVDQIESLEFSDLARKYEVFGVPKTIFNDTVSADGLVPPDIFVEKLYDAVEK